jgi:hypothetical protein
MKLLKEKVTQISLFLISRVFQVYSLLFWEGDWDQRTTVLHYPHDLRKAIFFILCLFSPSFKTF